MTLPHFYNPCNPESPSVHVFFSPFQTAHSHTHDSLSHGKHAQISSYSPSPDALLCLLCATWVLQWLRGEDVQDVRVSSLSAGGVSHIFTEKMSRLGANTQTSLQCETFKLSPYKEMAKLTSGQCRRFLILFVCSFDVRSFFPFIFGKIFN